MNSRQLDLSKYRIEEAKNSLKAAKICMENGMFKDSINRSYYSAFYAVKAVLALGSRDFKRHKDVMAYFNKEYVATGIFSKELGKRLGRLKQLREKSDYDDFFLASKDQAVDQYQTAGVTIQEVEKYLRQLCEKA